MKDKTVSIHEFATAYIQELTHVLKSLDKKNIELAANEIMQAYKRNKQIFIIGNGGSASTASHIACDLGKGTLARIYDNTEKRFRAISLTDNVALMTAFANDLSFDNIFTQQLRNLIKKGDLVLAISGSGNSLNIVNAVAYAKTCGARTIGFLGFTSGGKLGAMVDIPIIIQSNHYGPIEDTHLILGHLLASWLAKTKKDYDGIINSQNEATPFVYNK